MAPFFGVIYGFGILERYSVTFIVSVLFAVVFPQIINVLFPFIIQASQMLS
jgi:hypothetical protein